MRRASTLAASSSLLSRFLSTTHGSAAASASSSHRLLQVALYATETSNAFSGHRRRWFIPIFESFGSSRTVFTGVAGIMVSVAAAAGVMEVYAKEPPPPEVVPKDVVLYQYEACPFCNKVKGLMSSDS